MTYAERLKIFIRERDALFYRLVKENPNIKPSAIAEEIKTLAEKMGV